MRNNKLKKIAFSVVAVGALGLGIGGELSGVFNTSSAPPSAPPAPTTIAPAPTAPAPPPTLAPTTPAPTTPAPTTPPPVPAGPSLDGPATMPQIEGQITADQDDVDASIPGTGIALGGDGVHGYPHILVPGVYEGWNPLPVPADSGPQGPIAGPHGEKGRPLPTGTAIGPNGEHYAFYAIVPYNNPDGTQNTTNFTSPTTVVVDLASPGVPLFTLPISQASGAFDAQSGRMIIVGNTPSGDRALWQSDPVSQNPAWGKTLQQTGTFSGAMNGNRENQIVALPPNNGKSGGFLLVGASEAPVYKILGFVVGGGPLPVRAVTAATPQGLLSAEATDLVWPSQVPQVYGPTITDIQQANGKDTITMRVSTYGDGQYNPRTYKTTFTITS